ncbi:hypothetical protein KQI88_00030 [Alkaliphilus sp. MSJ-5]|uniref:Phage protein n=1 Tax=Alkaliphilus flagellatus TaxID=2841507 RepID=A0ABS6FY17_9FIRM|nr:hypothetical protein [Alkaliphilus flagellatus]MBU5674801.1 hypothetical protein [Alkaliphilus flagellatus]
MNMLREDIIEICKDFIEIVNILYKNGQITYEQYVEMTKLKFDYINNVE